MGWVDTRLKAVTVQALTVLLVTSLGAAEAWSDKIYWSEPRNGKIRRANLDGSEVEDVVRLRYMGSAVHGLVLDVTARNLYWTESRDRERAGIFASIRRADVNDTGDVEVLFSTKTPKPLPRGIALDPGAGKMYWTTFHGADDDNGIRRANLDGDRVEDLVLGGVRIPAGIALDPERGKMYWVEYGLFNRIRRANLDGSDVEDLVTQLDSLVAIALDLSVPGDCDADGDVDLADYLAFEACFTGPGIAVAADCGCADFDSDADADLADLVAFQAALIGPQ